MHSTLLFTMCAAWGRHNKIITRKRARCPIFPIYSLCYYEKLLIEYQTDIRKTWRVLNVITGLASDKTSCIDAFMVNGNSITDKTQIANEFCTYFAHIRKQYAEAIPPSRKTSKSYVTTAPNPKSLYFNPTDPFEINKIMRSFKAKKMDQYGTFKKCM